MKFSSLAFLIGCLLLPLFFAQTIISNCAGLQGISGNNLYVLNQTIDCTGYPFVSNITGFSGVLDGAFFSVINFTSNNGLIKDANSATIKNLQMLNVNINSTVVYTGAFVGYCVGSCTLKNLTLNTTSPNISNNILGIGYVGGLFGQVSGNIDNCISQNTYVYSNGTYQNVGGIASTIMLITVGVNSVMTNCHNLGFPSNPSATIVNSTTSFAGGLVGQILGVNLSKCGVVRGTILSTLIGSGLIIGESGNNNTVSQAYSRPEVKVISTTGFVGGLFGETFFSNGNYLNIDNVYVRGSISGTSSVGGIIGLLDSINTNGPNFIFTLQNSFASISNLTGSSSVGKVIGNMNPSTPNYTITFSNVYFNNQTNSYPAIGNGVTSTDGSAPVPLTCIDLYNTVSTNFTQGSIWGGDRLVSEYQYSYGPCSCPSGCPTTQPPTTLTPTTSTLAPTTQTQTPTTVAPIVCLYQVPNCDKCGPNGIVVDPNLFNVSCVLNGNKWVYAFSDKNSDTLTVTQSITLNETSALIQGNLNQSPNATIIVVVSSSSISENRASPLLNVTGCVTLSGDVKLVLSEQLQNGNVNVSLISYNCSQKVNVKESQIKVQATYKNNKCDKVGSKLNNQQNSLSVSLSSTAGENCKGISRGALIGIIVGVVGGSLLVVAVISVILLKRRRDLNDKLDKVGNEMQNT